MPHCSFPAAHGFAAATSALVHSEYTVKTRSTGQQAGLFYNLDSPLTRSLPLKRLMSPYDRVPRVFLLKIKKTRA